MENVLIATLGESPVVVTAMYDLLITKKQHRIDRLVVLYPQGGMVKEACDLVEEAMRDKPCVVELQGLSITDVNTTRDCMVFLQELYQRLAIHQANDDVVYLSLAGGRKSMSALMAWTVPYFSCIKELYHVIDKDEQDFWTVEQLYLDLSTEQRQRAMRPELSHLDLVDIPFDPLDPKLRISDEIRDRLASMTEEELDDVQKKNVEQAEAIQFGRNIAQGDKILNVMFTEYAADQFRKMSRHDVTHAQSFEICFGDMRVAPMLRDHVHHSEPAKGPSSKAVVYHYFKRHRTPERPVFYTLPKDIKNVADSEVKDIVVCSLEIEREGKYRSISEMLSTPKFSPEAAVSLDSLLSVKYVEGVLVVPLGTSPMVATQLYALLKHQGQSIREVVLIYPGSQELINGAELVKRALKEENGPPCRHVRIPGVKDIDSREACEAFEKTLEFEIDRIRKELSDAHVLLALSGGRKGMAALAVFVAMRKRIPYLYHTLISDDTLEKQIMKETTVRELSKPGLDKQIRNDRLFLRAYAGSDKELEEKFTLFTVPVLLPPV